VKLDGATGAERWRREIDGGAGGEDVAFSLGLAADGDAIVAGETARPGTGEDFTVLRLASLDGAERWNVSIDGAGAEDYANAVALDAAGDVVAAGQLIAVPGGYRFVVVKLAGSDGAERWRFVPNEPESSIDYGLGIAVDAAGDVVAAGRLDRIDTGDGFAIVKLGGADGAERWRATRQGHLAWSVALARGTNPVAAGSFDVPGGGSVLAALEVGGVDGVEIARTIVAGPPGTLGAALKVVIDDGGDAVAAGTTAGRYAVAKASSTIAGTALQLRDRPPPSGRKLVWRSRGPGWAMPTAGGAADPTLAGASLDVVNPGSGEHAVLALPAAGWTAVGTPGAPVYSFAGAKIGHPCTAVLVTPTKLKATCRGDSVGLSLDEPAQSSVVVRLGLGDEATAVRYCAAFGGVQRDQPGLFRAKAAPPPATCPIP